MVNLTTITTEKELLEKHFAESLLCAKSKEFQKAKTIMDVGTGAGFPGVPLAITHSTKQFVLLDAREKRLKIVEDLCFQINLDNAKTLHGRAEDIGRDPEHRERYDLCLSRAVAKMPTLLECCLPLVKVGGAMIAYKGKEANREIEMATEALEKLGGRIERIEIAKKREGATEPRLVYIIKERRVPAEYPRKAGKPSQNPL